MYVKLLVTLSFVFSFEVKSQEYPDPLRFYNEIKSELDESPFKKSDKPLIVFSGSSSIRFWIDLDNDFIEYDILNRGFGGSIFSDLNYFINELIIKHNPDLIVLYEGDNDIAFNIPTKYIYDDFKKSYELIRKKNENVPIIYIAPKPSPARWDKKNKYDELNNLIKEFCKMNQRTYYFDTWSIMIDNEGNIPKKYFWTDMLHMNKSGYQIWKKNLKPLINKILNNEPFNN
jgi:lysophospholipase L1-like esterase